MQLQKKQNPSIIQSNILLKDLTWFKTGGPARFFAQPQDAYEFAQALEFAQKNMLPIFVLGEGANILISDEGFNGLVIKPSLKEIYEDYQEKHSGCCTPSEPIHTIECNPDEILITAQSGVTLQDLITWCLKHHIIGLEEFSGIPGTIGGAVYINLHYFEFLLEQFLVRAHVIEKNTGMIIEVDRDWFEFGYNQSKLHDSTYYLLDATFKLKKANEIETAYARGRAVEIIRHRARRYPAQGTCGSFFRNFHENEVTLEDHGRKMIFVGYYLDKIGIKGNLRKGNAQVSYQHANMIVNLGNATSADIIAVAQTMQNLVFEQFGIIPQAECQLIGFKDYPLRKV